MIKPLLQNKEDQEQLEELGYVKIRLLNKEAVENLRSVFSNYFGNEKITQFIATNMIQPKELRKTIADELFEVLSTPLQQHFQEAKFWHPAFLAKPPSKDTEFNIHQDWTFVDESKYASGNIWIPLQSTNTENGTLHVLPKSHYKFLPHYRAQTLPYFFNGNEEYMKSLCEPVHVELGEAIVFLHSIVHYSPPNHSDATRVAISCGFHSAESPLYFLYANDAELLEKYLMPENYVFDFDDVEELNQRPKKGKLNQVFYHRPRIYTVEELKAMFHSSS